MAVGDAAHAARQNADLLDEVAGVVIRGSVFGGYWASRRPGRRLTRWSQQTTIPTSPKSLVMR
jgi:hypothetical protein